MLDRHRTCRIEGSADCHDCSWSDAEPGFRQRAGQHHRQTGHEVVTEAITTYRREDIAIPGQSTIFDFIEAA